MDSSPKQYLPCLLNSGTEVTALVDSGNLYRTCINTDLCSKLGFSLSKLKPLTDKVGTAKAGADLEVLGELPHSIHLSLGSVPTKFRFRPAVVRNLTSPLNLSSSFLRHHSFDQLHSQDSIRVQGRLVPLLSRLDLPHPTLINGIQPQTAPLIVPKSTQVPGHSEKMVTIHALESDLRHQDGVVDGSLQFMSDTDLHPVRRAVVRFQPRRGHLIAQVPVLNTLPDPITIPAGLSFGTCDWISKVTDNSRPWRISTLGPSHPNGPHEESKANDPLPDWMKGKTTQGNTAQRVRHLLNTFKLDQSPFLKDPRDLQSVVTLMCRFWTTFSWDGSYGKCDLLEHTIHTTDGPPINLRPRPINPNLEHTLIDQVKTWLDQKIIEPSSSPWNFPLVGVPKKNSTKVRWCVDYRTLNARTIKDAHPIGSISGNLSKLSSSSIFSTIDNAGAFHSVSLDQLSRPKTAFSTSQGHFQFCQLPFGLCNGPATYSRLVSLVLKDVPDSIALKYLDDVLIHSSSLSGHIDGLRQVFTAYEKAGMKLEPSKCNFFTDTVMYLGHVITRKGVAPDPQYLQIVKDWPLPTTRSQVRSFLGKIGYYRKFIQDYANTARPLTDILSDEVYPDLTDKTEFQPTQEMSQAFKFLKAKLLDYPILAHPQFGPKASPFILDTDWSGINKAIGAVLSQVQDGKERVILYAARKLTPAQSNYSPTKGELFGALYFMKLFNFYLAGKKFIMRTDHQALKHVRNMDPPLEQGVLVRWMDCLSNYDFEVIHRSGKSHGNCDSLSRAEHITIPTVEQLTASQILTESEDTKLVKTWKSSAIRPDKATLRHQTPLVKRLVQLWEHLHVEHNKLKYRPDRNTNVPVVDPDRVRPVLRRAHNELGHRGWNFLLQWARTRFYCPGLPTLCYETAMSCNPCIIKTKPSTTGQKGKLVSHDVSEPWHTLSLDFVGPLPVTKGGFKYLLTVKDVFTKYLEAIPTKDMSALTVAKSLVQDIFTRYGFCSRLHSDQGTQFMSTLLKELADTFDIQITNTPSYNPQSNPVERSHRDLNAALTALCSKGKPTDWLQHLPAALFASRIAVSQSTGFSPFFLMYGRHPKCHLDLCFPVPDQSSSTTADYVKDITESLSTAFQSARANGARALIRSESHYTKPFREFVVPSQVWLFTPRMTGSRKFASWWSGPWTITKRINELIYRISPDASWGNPAHSEDVSIIRLRPFHSDATYPHLPDEDDDLLNDDLTVLPLPAVNNQPPDELDPDELDMSTTEGPTFPNPVPVPTSAGIGSRSSISVTPPPTTLGAPADQESQLELEVPDLYPGTLAPPTSPTTFSNPSQATSSTSLSASADSSDPQSPQAKPAKFSRIRNRLNPPPVFPPSPDPPTARALRAQARTSRRDN